MTHLCVYIVESQGYFKIGKTSDLKWRIAALQNANPIDLRVVHAFYTEKNTSVENALHQIFSNRRKRGEWFQLSEDDINSIVSMTVDEILDRAITGTKPFSAAPKTKTSAGTWLLNWETIHLPQEFITPIRILNDALQGDKRHGALFSSFVLIFNLAWETDYKCTPLLNAEELRQYLKLSRRQFFAQKSAMEKLGWLTTYHFDSGMIQFGFDESLLEVSAS